jgi:hypothetical protein
VASETPEAGDSQDGDEGEDSLERTNSTTSPPPALLEDIVVDKKRKRIEDFASSSASAHRPHGLMGVILLYFIYYLFPVDFDK